MPKKKNPTSATKLNEANITPTKAANDTPAKELQQTPEFVVPTKLQKMSDFFNLNNTIKKGEEQKYLDNEGFIDFLHN